jgi:biopolymer transport protein ExbD
MAFSSGNESGGPMAEINVTPLVDVMLVLLIIFMITAPLMSHKVKVELPEANLDRRDDKKVQEVTPITIAVEDTGAIYWNDEPISKGLLESRLSIEAQKLPQAQLNVRGDKTAKYRLVNEVVQIAQAQGMRKVGFVAIKDKSGQ